MRGARPRARHAGDRIEDVRDVDGTERFVLVYARKLTQTARQADATREVAERFAEAAETAGGPLSVEACAAVVGTWDRLRIEQILLNLIGNALKYAPRAPVEISVEANEEKAKLMVRDHGRGVLPADFVRIFSRFERAVPARNYAGLGLGLYIAREIALAHGGGIGVARTPGQGATFLVELPLESATGRVAASLSG